MIYQNWRSFTYKGCSIAVQQLKDQIKGLWSIQKIIKP